MTKDKLQFIGSMVYASVIIVVPMLFILSIINEWIFPIQFILGLIVGFEVTFVSDLIYNNVTDE